MDSSSISPVFLPPHSSTSPHVIHFQIPVLIFFNCVCVDAYRYAYTHLMLSVHICPGMATLYWTTYVGACSQRKLSIPFLAAIVHQQLFIQWEDIVEFPQFILKCQSGLRLLLFRHLYCCESMDTFSLSRGHFLAIGILILWSYTVSSSPFIMLSMFGWRHSTGDVLRSVRHNMNTYSQHFDQLGISVVVSI